MSISRARVLALTGIVAAIGAAGGLDPHHFPGYFLFAGTLVVLLLGIPIVVLTKGLIAIEKALGKYGRYVAAFLCAAPGLALWVLFRGGGGDAGYAFTVIACFIGWGALWFTTAPRTVA